MYAEEDGAEIDGIHNAKEHARYLKSILDYAGVEVNSIGDFGFGKAVLLHEIVKEFKPNRIFALDPSLEAVKNLENKRWIKNRKHKILRNSLENFNDTKIKRPFDLGICNSIFQYIPTKDVSNCYKKLSKLCKYLYFSVPTQLDYEYMKKELHFIDTYANSRKKEFYLKALQPYFSIVSHNLLESKTHIKESGFVYEFFRF